MTSLPNPFSNSGASSPPDDAAVPFRPQVPEGTAADLSCIGEIFVGAAKLEPPEIWFENSAYPREDELLFEVLEAMVDPRVAGIAQIPDEAAFMIEIGPLPLFMRQAEAAA